MFEIRSDLPIPAAASNPRNSKYPLAQLEPGQCFVIPADEVPAKGISSIRAAIYKFRADKGKARQFQPALLENGDVGVWRVE